MTSYFGNGDYGYGLYGVSTPQALTGLVGGVGFSGSAYTQPLPQLHGSTGVLGLASSVTLARTSSFRALTGALTLDGATAPDLWNVLHGATGALDLDGWAYMNEQVSDHETVRMCNGAIRLSGGVQPTALLSPAVSGAFALGGRVRTVPQVAVYGPLGVLDLDGAAFPIVTQPIPVAGSVSLGGALSHIGVSVRYRAVRGQIGLPGAVSAQIWPVLHRPRGQISLRGVGQTAVLFGYGGLAGQFAAYGAAHTSYLWSDQTFPGRVPVAPWSGAPGNTGEDWQGAPAVTQDWADAAPVAGPWSEAVGASDDWQEI